MTGVLTAFAVPNAGNETVFLVLVVLVGFVEGIVLVATPAMVRDFSPQLGRAVAMGFWTLGPVVGSLLVAGVSSNTLPANLGVHPHAWKGQFVAAGLVDASAGGGGRKGIDVPIQLDIDDFAIERTEHITTASTVLAIDRFGNLGLNVDRADVDAAGLASGDRVELLFPVHSYYAVVAETFADASECGRDECHARTREHERHHHDRGRREELNRRSPDGDRRDVEDYAHEP